MGDCWNGTGSDCLLLLVVGYWFDIIGVTDGKITGLEFHLEKDDYFVVRFSDWVAVLMVGLWNERLG